MTARPAQGRTRGSMGRRLIWGFGGSFIALSLLSSAALYVLIGRELRAQRGARLQDRLDAIATLLKSPAHGRDELARRVLEEWPARGGEQAFVQVLDGRGRIVVETAGAPPGLRAALGRMEPRASAQPDPGEEIRALDAGEDRRFLARAEIFENSIGLEGPVVARAAVGEEQSLDFLGGLRRTLAGIFLGNALVSLLVGWRVVRREMRPLDRIAAQIARIGPGNLRERVAGDGLPTELRALVAALNGAMDGLASAMDRLSRFSSDIAHELRTPIGNMMGSIEVALARPRPEAEYVDLLASSFEECARLNRIADSLLFLARAENDARARAARPLALRAELEGLLEFYEPLAEESGVRLNLMISGAGESAGELLAEPTLFQRAVGNLISNAIRYSPPGGSIEVSYRREGRDMIIAVADEGLGIPEKDLPRIFERFYRVDASRANESGGSGLGLAIVKSIVELHGGTIEAESRLGAGTKLRMRWPAASPGEPPSAAPKKNVEENRNPAV